MPVRSVNSRFRQDFEHSLGGAGDDCLFAADDHRALHQLGVIEQEGDDLLARLIALLVEAELFEALVLAHQRGWFSTEQPEDASESGPIERLLEVLDDVARDAALAQDVQRAARLPSPRVVVDEHAFHGAR